jgi:tRNA(fMet)-specific endonuclease VapC
MARLIADTSLLISVGRKGQTLASLVDDGDDLGIAAVTAAEMLVGVELASPRHRKARRVYVERMLEDLTIEDYTLHVARAHASLLAYVRRTGRPRGVIDLMIAATAAAGDRIVITADRSAFEGLPGVELRD